MLKIFYNENMAKTNFKLKVAKALKSLMTRDEDLWKGSYYENAFNSNLYKRIGKRKNTTLEMEFDKYCVIVTAAHFSSIEWKKIEAIDNRLTGKYSTTYKPRPDVISHNNILRKKEYIDCIIECKFAKNISGIKKDFWKLLCYKALYNVPQLIIVVYPEKDSITKYGKIDYFGSFDVWKWDFLEEKLNLMEPFQGAIFNIDPNMGQIRKSIDVDAIFSMEKIDEEGNFKIKLSSDGKKYREIGISKNQVTLDEEKEIDEGTKRELQNGVRLSNEIVSFNFDSILTHKNLNLFLEKLGVINPLNSNVDYFGIKRFYRVSVIFNDNYEQNYLNDEAYNSLRNLIVFTKVEGELIMLLPGELKNEKDSFKLFEKEFDTYFERDTMENKKIKTKWKAYKSKKDTTNNEEGFLNLIANINSNKLEIAKIALSVYEEVWNNKNKFSWSQQRKVEFVNKVKTLKEYIDFLSNEKM